MDKCKPLMLGIPLNYEDMEAFDPDYHRNLVYMLEHRLEESGLDHLTFSASSMYFDVEEAGACTRPLFSST